MNQTPTTPRDDEPYDSADRGRPDVGRSKPASRIWLIAAVGVAIALIAALGVMAALDRLAARGQRADAPATETVVTADDTGLTPAAFGVPTPPTPTVATPTGPSQPAQPDAQQALQAQLQALRAQLAGATAKLTPEQQKARDLVERRKRAPVIAVSAGTAAAAPARKPAHEGRGNASGSLGRALHATRAGAVTATLLPDPDMTITQGRLLPCVLETAIHSDLPGMTSCVLTRDIYSTSSRVLLLERGSRLVGQYQSGQLRGGQSRIFLLWTRAETPQGVLINLDSPASDSLGLSGVGGSINRHFWERFGAALLISVVEDLGEIQAAKESSGGGSTSIAAGGISNTGQNAASIIVGNTTNIPPTLNRAQGSSIGVFVARDLYFGDVYALQPRDAGGPQ